MSDQLQVGDVVRPKHDPNAPFTTIQSIDDGVALCARYDVNHQKEIMYYDLEELMPAHGESPKES